VTIDADALGREHLGRPLGNVGVLAALVRATGLVAPEVARRTLRRALEKRRIPERLVTANLALFDAAFGALRLAEVPPRDGTDHRRAAFHGYGALPVAAQAALRSARNN